MQVRPAIQRKGGSRLAGAVSRLDIVCMGSVIVWAGFYNSWNVAFAAGFGTCLIAFVLVGAAYYYLCGCLSTISSVIPFSGGAYGLARGSLGFYPGFVVGCCEAIQYMIFVTVCSIYAAQYTCALFPAATQVRALIWALVVGSSILIHAVCSKRCVYRILVGIAIVDLLALVVFCLGSLKFANFYDNALVVRDIPATAATVSGRQYYVDSNSCDSFSVANGSCKEPTIILDLHQVFRRLIQCSGWSILMNGNIPFLDDLYQRKSSITVDLYCLERKQRYDVNYDFDPAALRILGSLRMSHLQRAAKLKLLFSQYYDDRCFLEGRYTEVTSCECGCINMVSSWISNCQREEIVNTRHQLMADIDRFCYPYEFLSFQIRKLLCENSQEGLAEQFWRGNWQPRHTATILNTVQSYNMRNGNLSFSAWLRYASRIVRKCYIAMMNCLLDMRCLSPKRVAYSTDRFIQGGYMPCSSCTP
jgi:hypothetical protein